MCEWDYSDLALIQLVLVGSNEEMITTFKRIPLIGQEVSPSGLDVDRLGDYKALWLFYVQNENVRRING